jgi:hypothetical protein
VGAQLPPSGQAVPAETADDVALTGDEVARLEVVHVRADLDDVPTNS